MNALERLRAAGQFAAPELLATLVDLNQKSLHPYVTSAMVAIGRPMVNPLSTALPELEPVPMGHVARVLTQIGYPEALPAMKLVIEDQGIDSGAREAVDSAYRQLAASRGIAAEQSAADLFLALGMKYYFNATSGEEVIAGYD